MKKFLITSLSCLTVLLVAGCVTRGSRETSHEGPKIDRVFFAQHHVLEPESPHFKLVGNLDALIKVQVYSETPVSSPYAVARLELEGRTAEVPLTGPKMLPRKPSGDPVLMVQAYSNSFTALIAKEWVKTGLKVNVELRDFDYSGVDSDDKTHEGCSAPDYIKVLDRKSFDQLRIGAPSQLVIQMFDFHFFGRGQGADYPQGWEEELEAKLPVSSLTIRRVKNIMLNELVMPPRDEIPSQRYSSMEDYKAKTGKDFDGEQSFSMQWSRTLKAAGGREGGWRLYNVNIAGVYSGGLGGGFCSCANLHKHGVLIHELGHALGLPHWISSYTNYPYQRTMYGENLGEPCTANAGPLWAFDIKRREFLAPADYLPDGSIIWKRDPMMGGGRSNMKTYMYSHFSDYSMSRMQQRLESGVCWNEDLGKYARWNQKTGAYDQVVENNGIKLPLERDAEVISILASANLKVPAGNIVYPPIGPYTAGLIRLFDADSPEDRKAAVDLGYVRSAACNTALRVTQGGKTKSYVLNVALSPNDNPLNTFNTAAVNLAAAEGDISRVELIYCKELMLKGITPDHTVLSSWENVPNQKISTIKR
jgi:hypothetical protein